MKASHHFIPLSVAALVGLSWAAGEGIGHGAEVTTHDLSRDFSIASNPNGVWSYGWKTSLDGTLTLFNYSIAIQDAGVPVVEWGLGPGQIPMIFHNNSTNLTVNNGEGIYPPKSVFLHAGFDGWPQNYCVVRFTVPSDGAGQYRLESAVKSRLDGAISTDGDYHVAVNNLVVFSEFIPPNSSTGYTNVLSLASGDTIDFLVGRGADDRQYGSGLKIQATLTTPVVCTPHKAKAVAELVNGFVVGARVTDAGCGYTNPPIVLIRGGGGQGAVASAVITDGVVTAIQISDAGCCYTNTPRILIGSPPFVPKVAIATSKVKVTQNVVLGWKYVLESSKDLVQWAPTGPVFIAESEEIVDEFDVDVTGTYFRVRVVP